MKITKIDTSHFNVKNLSFVKSNTNPISFKADTSDVFVKEENPFLYPSLKCTEYKGTGNYVFFREGTNVRKNIINGKTDSYIKQKLFYYENGKVKSDTVCDDELCLASVKTEYDKEGNILSVKELIKKEFDEQNILIKAFVTDEFKPEKKSVYEFDPQTGYPVKVTLPLRSRKRSPEEKRVDVYFPNSYRVKETSLYKPGDICTESKEYKPDENEIVEKIYSDNKQQYEIHYDDKTGEKKFLLIFPDKRFGRKHYEKLIYPEDTNKEYGLPQSALVKETLSKKEDGTFTVLETTKLPLSYVRSYRKDNTAESLALFNNKSVKQEGLDCAYTPPVMEIYFKEDGKTPDRIEIIGDNTPKARGILTFTPDGRKIQKLHIDRGPSYVEKDLIFNADGSITLEKNGKSTQLVSAEDFKNKSRTAYEPETSRNVNFLSLWNNNQSDEIDIDFAGSSYLKSEYKIKIDKNMNLKSIFRYTRDDSYRKNKITNAEVLKLDFNESGEADKITYNNLTPIVKNWTAERSAK